MFMRYLPALVLCTAGCGTTVGGVAVTVLTLGIGALPSQQIAQTYYVGILDPLEQLPPMLYRITLRGEASLVSQTSFASGWVKAELVDSLQSRIGFDAEGRLEVRTAEGEERVELKVGRRFWLFGPEGFREAPAGHRLVVVMGGNPSAFFDAANEVLGELNSAAVMERDGLANQSRRVLEALLDVMQEEEQRRKEQAQAKGAASSVPSGTTKEAQPTGK